MEGRVEGERDQGNAHLVQDRGQIGPTKKGMEGEKGSGLLACLRIDSSTASFGAKQGLMQNQGAHTMRGRLSCFSNNKKKERKDFQTF